MAHIQVPEGAPGILGPMAISPESTKALRALVEVLLRGPNTLTPAEREMIAMYVSSQNDCCFCQLSHGAAAAEDLGGTYDLVDRVKRDYATAEISDKLKSLLAIAGKVQKGGKHVASEDVARARQQGATERLSIWPLASGNPGEGSNRGGNITKTASEPAIARPRLSPSVISATATDAPFDAQTWPLASSRTTARTCLPIPSRRPAAPPPTRPVIPIIENMMVLRV